MPSKPKAKPTVAKRKPQSDAPKQQRLTLAMVMEIVARDGRRIDAVKERLAAIEERNTRVDAENAAIRERNKANVAKLNDHGDRLTALESPNRIVATFSGPVTPVFVPTTPPYTEAERRADAVAEGWELIKTTVFIYSPDGERGKALVCVKTGQIRDPDTDWRDATPAEFKAHLRKYAVKREHTPKAPAIDPLDLPLTPDAFDAECKGRGMPELNIGGVSPWDYASSRDLKPAVANGYSNQMEAVVVLGLGTNAERRVTAPTLRELRAVLDENLLNDIEKLRAENADLKSKLDAARKALT